MGSALVAGLFGLVAVILKGFDSWVGPRRQRELMRLDLELLEKAKVTSPRAAIALEAIVAARATQWLHALSPERVYSRRGNQLFLPGLLSLLLANSVQHLPGPSWWLTVRGALRFVLEYGGLGVIVAGSIFFLLAAREASAQAKEDKAKKVSGVS